MKVATVADLRNHFPRVARWIEDGEKVQIRKRGKVFATLSPPKAKKKQKLVWPDLYARLKKIYPHPLPGKPASELISEGRGDR
jgi:antitoxin (DNA-binding transcriptional repressor) of toxin-antitoxin stability system